MQETTSVKAVAENCIEKLPENDKSQSVRHKNLVGQRFRHLEVVEYAGRIKNRHHWKCKCDCGRETIVRESNLLDGHTASCGCLSAPYKYRHLIHGTCVENLKAGKISSANTSGYRGVCWDKKNHCWVARIALQGKSYYLGSFKSIEEAVEARKEGEEMHRNFLNWYYSKDSRDKTETT